MTIPQHVAIIMDGNGRWAKLRGRPRIYGHVRGSAQVRPIVRECGRLGVKYLTLYCFSNENWGRPSAEVAILMRLLEKYLVRERKTLMANNVRLNAIGDISALPQHALLALRETIALTAQNTGLTLTFAVSYGSRQEIIEALRTLAQEVRSGVLNPGQINEDIFNKHLFTKSMPDPDLIIRSSGEMRLSNFLLWQGAYSELYFTEKFWPEFSIEELRKAFKEYSQRRRRFGLTEDQGEKPPHSKTLQQESANQL
jgi:undecaprenyl diphosphate synthase